MVFEEQVKDITQASWRPMPKGIYPDRPQSPQRKGKDGEVATPLFVAPVPVKKQAYRPPHATGALAAEMRRSKESQEVKKIVYAKPEEKTPSAPVNLIPGLAAPTGKATKNNKKKKLAETDDGGDGEIPTLPAPVKEKTEAKAAPAPAPAPAPEVLDADSIAKKIKVGKVLFRNQGRNLN